MGSPGTCVIIFNDNSNDQNRAKDLDLISGHFKKMQYTVHLLEDMTVKEIMREMGNILTKMDSNEKSFVCCVLARGTEGVFVTKNKSIMSFFTLRELITRTKSLFQKPKIMILDIDYALVEEFHPQGAAAAADSHFACITSILSLHPTTGQSVFLEQFCKAPKGPLKELVEGTRPSIEDIVRRYKIKFRLGKSVPSYLPTTGFEDSYSLGSL